VLGIDQKYGVKIIPTKEASWAGVRDKLVNGELDFAHVLYGLVYGVHVGIGGPKKDMAVLMTLNNNGQAITLSKKLADKGAVDGAGLAKLMASDKREYTFAQTFPTGTHAMWLYYWMGGQRHRPDAGRQGHHRAAAPDGGQHARGQHGRLLRGRALESPRHHRRHRCHRRHHPGHLKDHPEKVLGTTGDYVKKYPNTCRAVTAAIIEAGRWIDSSLANKNKMAETIADKSFVNTSVDAINQRILGRYQNGMGKTWDDPNHMKFYNEGAVTLPYLSDGMWFLTQHKRWGLLKEHPDYLAVAKQVNQIDIYKQAAAAAKGARAQGCDAHQQADGRRSLGTGKDPRNTPIRSRSRPERPSLQEKHHGQCRLPRALRGPHPHRTVVLVAAASQRSEINS
jgi:nitrate/nitrite transport system substrate-binding protein